MIRKGACQLKREFDADKKTDHSSKIVQHFWEQQETCSIQVSKVLLERNYHSWWKVGNARPWGKLLITSAKPGSLDSSSLYVIMATLYPICHLTGSQWNSFSLLDMLMQKHWHVTTWASAFWIRWMETFQVLSADTQHSRIGTDKFASYEWTGYTLGMCLWVRMWKKHDLKRADIWASKDSLLSRVTPRILTCLNGDKAPTQWQLIW